MTDTRRRYLKLDQIEPNTFKGGCNIVLKHKIGDTRYRYVLTSEDRRWLIGALERMGENEDDS